MSGIWLQTAIMHSGFFCKNAADIENLQHLQVKNSLTLIYSVKSLS